MKIAQYISKCMVECFQQNFPDFSNAIVEDKTGDIYKIFGILISDNKYIFNGLKGIINRFKLDTTFDRASILVKAYFTDLSNISQNINVNVNIKNFTLIFDIENTYLSKYVEDISKNGFGFSNMQKKILVDFSSPNIAKDMHVGHLRSTIIGDSVCRIFEAYGHEVIRTNHIGDFGLPFGMVIQYILDNKIDHTKLDISELQKIYANSKIVYDLNLRFNIEAHEQVKKLQDGDSYVSAIWKSIRNTSMIACNDIYNKLDIKLDDIGESYYREMIPRVINELEEKGLVETDDNKALIIKVNGYKFPLILVKGDGAYTYDTTDLTAIWYRLNILNVDEIYYIVDYGQKDHFKLIFEVAKLAGWLKKNQKIYHIDFGLVLGEDGKKIKSRDGGTIKLSSLLDDSVKKANEKMTERLQKIDSSLCNKIMENIAYSAVKYADLSTTRTSDYKFSFDRMLAFDGNTAVYLLYAFTRLKSIQLKCEPHIDNMILICTTIIIQSDNQKNICKLLVQFEDILDKVQDTLMFHVLCDYLYKIATAFHSLYKSCRVLQYDTDKKTIVDVDYSVYKIFLAIRNVMQYGLDILGIKTVDVM